MAPKSFHTNVSVLNIYDTGDWIADILGAASGALLVVIALMPRMLQRAEKSSRGMENMANTLD